MIHAIIAMEVVVHQVTKAFGREVVLRGVSHTFASGSRTALLGPNGSGKSTLLQVVAGVLAPTSGAVSHGLNGMALDPEAVYRHVAIAAPYLGLYEDLSLREVIGFHQRFKPLLPGIGLSELARIVYLQRDLEKPVRHFSSGMKQRLKLALAILSDTPLLLLDEPCSNLDAEAVAWYGELLSQNLGARTLLVASNRQASETALCRAVLDLERSAAGSGTGTGTG
ncbi:MAG: ABC transporter ATP-binding protein [Flavobacteriales bacterium]|nr:ABC transporter ATP-binding protein [Flavobacteriales bacterium]